MAKEDKSPAEELQFSIEEDFALFTRFDVAFFSI
jgi:hypothetical protein